MTPTQFQWGLIAGVFAVWLADAVAYGVWGWSCRP